MKVIGFLPVSRIYFKFNASNHGEQMVESERRACNVKGVRRKQEKKSQIEAICWEV